MTGARDNSTTSIPHADFQEVTGSRRDRTAEDGPATGRDPGGIRWVRWSAAGVVGVLVMAAAATLGWEWRHPTAFSEQGFYRLGANPARQPQVFGLGQVVTEPGGPSVITLHHLEAAVTKNPQGATTRFLRCHPRSAQQSEVGVLTLRGAEELCELSAVSDGTRLDVTGSRKDYLLMEVTFDGPGTFEAAGFEVAYSWGWQTGTQRTGPDITVTRTSDSVSR